MVGKTNMDQFAAGLVGTRTPFGNARNAFDDRFIPGGSSSGSGALVGSGLVSFALGTDTAGSGNNTQSSHPFNAATVKPTPCNAESEKNQRCAALLTDCLLSCQAVAAMIACHMRHACICQGLALQTAGGKASSRKSSVE